MEREKVIVKTSLVGVFTNILLAGFKAAVGAVTGSIAVVLDAINNLSDVLSSVVTIIGTKLAGKKPDKEHPLGHGRAEYIGTMIVAAIILYAGVAAGVESIKKIINPTKPDYSLVSLIIVGTAVVVKILLGRYVSAMGKKVNSGSLIASGSDALFDAVVSASVLLSALICKFMGVNLEAYVGLLIAVFIIRIDRELVEAVRGTICENENVSGAYDLILHSYGPGRLIGSVHVEIPAEMKAYEIDRMQRSIAENVYTKHGVVLAGIGVYSKDDRHGDMRDKVNEIVRRHDGVLQIHGFFADPEKKQIVFDVILDFSLADRNAVLSEISEDVRKAFPEWDVNVTMDVDI